MGWLSDFWSGITGQKKRKKEENNYTPSRTLSSQAIKSAFSPARPEPSIKPFAQPAPVIEMQQSAVQKPPVAAPPKKLSNFQLWKKGMQGFVDEGEYNVEIPKLQEKFNPKKPLRSAAKGLVDLTTAAVSEGINTIGNTGLDVARGYEKSDGSKVNFKQLRSPATRLSQQVAASTDIPAAMGWRKPTRKVENIPTRRLDTSVLDDPAVGIATKDAGNLIMQLSNLYGTSFGLKSLANPLKSIKAPLARKAAQLGEGTAIGLVGGGAGGADASEGQTLRQMAPDIALSGSLGGLVGLGAAGALPLIGSAARRITPLLRAAETSVPVGPQVASQSVPRQLTINLRKALRSGDDEAIRIAEEAVGNVDEAARIRRLQEGASIQPDLIPNVADETPLPPVVDAPNITPDIPTSTLTPEQIPVLQRQIDEVVALGDNATDEQINSAIQLNQQIEDFKATQTRVATPEGAPEALPDALPEQQLDQPLPTPRAGEVVEPTPAPLEAAAIPNPANALPEAPAPIYPPAVAEEMARRADIPETAAVEGASTGNADIDALLKAVQEAEVEYKANLTPRANERARRFNEGDLAFEDAGGGEAGLSAFWGAQKGKLPENGFNPLDVPRENRTGMINQIMSDKRFQSAERGNIATAFQKLWGTDVQGRKPAPHDIKSIRKFLGETLKDNPTAQKQMDDALATIEEIAAVVPDKNWKDVAGQLAGVPRTLQTIGDISAMGRQGITVAGRHPGLWAKALADSVRYIFDPKYFDEDMARMANSPEFATMVDRMNLELTATRGVSEESLVSADMLGKIPGLGHVFNASDRSYSGALTKLRYNLAKQWIDKNGGLEALAQKLDDETLAHQGQVFNTFTGVGGNPNSWSYKHSSDLSKALFAPRLWHSRLSMLNPAFYARLSPQARNEALGNMAGFLGLAGGSLALTLAALKQSGVDASVELEPTSSDFLKLKVGNTRYDPFAGLQQNIVLAARLWTGKKTSSLTGNEMILGDGYGADTRFDLLINTLNNKLAPIPSFAAKLSRSGPGDDPENPFMRKDEFGEPLNVGDMALNLFTPFTVQGIRESYEDTGSMKKSVMMNLPNLLGIGTQTYGLIPTKDVEGTQAIKDEKAVAEDLSSRGIPDVNRKRAAGELGFADEVQRYRESDNFTIVAEALENQYKTEEAKGAPQKDLQKIQHDIDVARVAEKNAITYADLSLYYGGVTGNEGAGEMSNTEFKKLLDPEDEMYDPDLASKLYQIDTLMAEAGVSSNTTDKSKNYYEFPKPKKGRGGSGGLKGLGASSISAPTSLSRLNLNTLSPEALASVDIPDVKPITGRQLVAPRKITVS